jgi:hypothetical protein
MIFGTLGLGGRPGGVANAVTMFFVSCKYRNNFFSFLGSPGTSAP